MFEQLNMPKPDALHGVTAKYEADERSDKMDLGVGVYKDWTGASPIMDCVRVASEKLAQTEKTKSYLSLKGHEGFIEHMQRLIGPSSLFSRVACVHSVGGTGGISLALELAKLANPDLVVHIGVPTWPNHISLANRLNLRTNLFEYFDVQSQSIQGDRLRSVIDGASPGDVLIFHGPCHNPTGADLCENSYWDFLRLADAKGLVVLIDSAYYGLGNELENDLARLRDTIDKMSTAFLVMSCSKSFGLYRERTGILFAITPSEAQKRVVQARLEMIGRHIYSMPPSHGAAVVSEILSDESLTDSWQSELKSMRERVATARCELARFSQGLRQLECIPMQKGIFSLLPIDAKQVDRFAREHAIYMPPSGRINIAGLKTGDAQRFCDAMAEIRLAA